MDSKGGRNSFSSNVRRFSSIEVLNRIYNNLVSGGKAVAMSVTQEMRIFLLDKFFINQIISGI